MAAGGRGRWAAGALGIAALMALLVVAPSYAADSEPPPVDANYEALEGLIRSFQTDSPLITPAVRPLDPAPPVDPFSGEEVADNFWPDGQPSEHIVLDALLPPDQALTIFGSDGPAACGQPRVVCPPDDAFFGPDGPPSGPLGVRLFGIDAAGDATAAFDGDREWAFAFDTPASGEWQQQVGADAFHLTDCAVILRQGPGEAELLTWTPQGFAPSAGPMRVVHDPAGPLFILGPGHPCFDASGYRSMSFAAMMGERRPGYVAAYLHPAPNAPEPLFALDGVHLLDLTAVPEPPPEEPEPTPEPESTQVDSAPPPEPATDGSDTADSGDSQTISGAPVAAESDGFPFGGLVAVGIPVTLAGVGAVAYDRRRRRLQDAPDDEGGVNIMEAMLEGFSLSGLEKDTADLDRIFHSAENAELAAQHRLETEYERLATAAGEHLAAYIAAMRRFQAAYVRALSGSTQLQGLLQQFAEARGIAQKQDLALAIVTLVRGLGTLTYRGVQWARTGATAARTGEGAATATVTGTRAATAGERTAAAGAAAGRGAETLVPLAGQVPEWVATADRLRRNAKNLQRLPGVHDVFIHGHPTLGFMFQSKATGKWSSLAVSRLAQLIARQGWKPGMPVRLFSCHSASTGAAAALAARLKTWVYAPTMKIWINGKGVIAHDPGGFTVLFDPNGIARFVLVNGAKIALKG